MVSKESIEELFSEWPCQPDDPQLVSLITDRHAGRFVKGFWEVHGNAEGKGNEKNEGEAAATGKGSSEEEGNKDLGNNATLMAIASTLDKISKKFDLMDERFKKPLLDQKSIDDMVKAAVEERLKVMGI
ncbi:ULP_PROTEASE domain-containing protein [Raphanus sativus]|nr:ULP_PROTEASE domain-containing protein [Raphanus sativus]